ncbi:CBS domain-containing protein [archaeon]|nr:CBS domain-containing protein [archaeon]
MEKMEEIRKMPIREIMQTKVGWLKETDLIERAVDVLCSNDISTLPVKNEQGKLVGELVERDLLKSIIDPNNMSPHELMFEPLLAMSYFPKTVHDVMRPVRLSFKPDDTVEYAARRLFRKQSTLAPVLENNKLVGIITEDDLVRLMSDPVGKPECNIVKLEPEALH